MKKEYKMPQIEVFEMNAKNCLLSGSTTPTDTSVTVDEWIDD